ncbi:single-stranded-DNA-specific exonuclease RecJ [Humisphaera borealis]|uniref:Single-stranded-DNA-specific exonuclease RecJ n=1 Tax=Humisphaera borealis TaxID=2807512 RepID=A0A7M2X0L3_9BACT|nr:DHHA1 domain-containing protein [Humisphaera borealis]QOV91298.1 DHH family phosphoesterase [Humisphaera borealis]
MHRAKQWNLAPRHPAAEELASRLKVSPLIAQMLLTRGISEPADGQAFLRPSLAALHRPETLHGVTQASDRIARAIRDKDKIVIYGDYDVDGITASAILWHAIRVLGGVAEYYVPHRIEEGYGLNATAIGQLCDRGARLIITVDCGITAIEPSKVARDRGVDLIITDHHEWKEEPVGTEPRTQTGTKDETDGTAPSLGTSLPSCLPHAHTLVHPRLPTGGAPYGNPHLCGAGVAFKLAWGIGLAMSGAAKVSEEFKAYLIDATALAALGTIADVVPLVGENRALAHFGLSGLKESNLTGIKALIASAGLTGQKLSSFDVGFKLGPRLNACGRMGHAQLAVEMLTTADAAKAEEIATYLEGQNKARQAVEKKIAEQASQQAIELGYDGDDSRAVVLGDAGWHPGVIGIVASRIVEKFHRPAIMVALNGTGDDAYGQGSGRSIAGFHLAKALHAVGEHLEAYGGHEMAAGLKVKASKFEDFRHAFRDYAFDAITPAQLIPQLRLDAEATIPQCTEALVRDLDRLGPFGHANPRPVLCIKGLEIAAPARRVGKTGDHLQLQLRKDGRIIKAIGFGYGKLEPELKVGGRVDVAGEPTTNEWNGRVTVEMEIKDLSLS